jgi:hypothetical protein
MSPLLIATIGNASVRAAALTGVAVGLGALASVLRVWIEQVARTRRLERALMNSDPSQRAEIIVACSALENKAAKPVGNSKRARKPSLDSHVGLARHEKLALRPRGRSKD